MNPLRCRPNGLRRAMPFNSIDLIKFIPPAARRILEVTRVDTGLAGIFSQRAPLATVTSAAPDALPEASGFDCIALFSSVDDSDRLASLLDALPPQGQVLAAPDALVSSLDKALEKSGCRVFDPGTVLRAWKASEAPPSIALHCTITPELAADAEIRVHWPNGFLRTIPGLHPMAQVEGFSPSLSVDAEYRILLMHRAIPRLDRDVAFLRSALEAGYLIVLDLDDDPLFFGEHFEDDAFALRSVHAAQVSTPAIAQRLAEFVPEIAVFGNHLPLLPPSPARPESRIRIFVGGYNRGGDWEEIREPANRVLRHFDDRIEVEVMHERSIFESLDVTNKRFTPRCPYQEYLDRVGRSHIALLPLRDTPFNRCKSDLKFIECAAHQVAALAPLTVYGAAMADGETGILYRSASEFAVGLQRLIQEADLRNRLAGGARDYVASNRMLADHYRARYDWYLKLIENADSLRAAHRARVPELYD